MSNLIGYFEPYGPAVIQATTANPNPPKPVYNGLPDRTCSNIACHGQPGGSFNYYFPGGDGEPVLNTFTFGPTYPTTPSWYSDGQNCLACHGNPPANGGVWHSGFHGGGNDCQLCHPDATGTGGKGISITNPTQHRDGVITIQAQFKSSCFGCH